MALVSLREVSVRFGGDPVLDRVSLSIEKGERGAVTGRNGEGKSTLLKTIAGILEADDGEVIREKGIKIAYLSQDVPADRPADPDFNRLSGGKRRKKLLEAELLANPDLLLLDEPTNHLDVETIEWLESYLRRFKGACLFVTHDREFLKRVATRILDLDRGELAGWNCDYVTFLKRKAELLADEATFWERKSKKLAQEEAWIRRGVKARTTRNEGRVAALMKLREEFAARRSRTGTSNLRLDAGEKSGDLVLKATDVSFGYVPDKLVVKDFTAKILRGERIGVVGPNGCGKSTLLKLLTGALVPMSGEIVQGTRVTLAYLDQLRESIDPEKSVIENLAEDRDEVVVAGVKKHVYSYLQDFLFTPERGRTPVKALSGGEKARLVLAKRFMDPGNLLVLDEPTNDLDVETLELLEEQLASYTGTVLLVSHDRAFLDNVATSTLVLPGDGSVLALAGGWAEASRALNAWREAREREAAAARAANAAPAETPASRPAKFSYKEQREYDALPKRIEALETEIAAIEEELSSGTVFAKDPARAQAITARLGAARAELDAAETRWLELEERKG